MINNSLVADIKTFDISKETDWMIRNRIDKVDVGTMAEISLALPDLCRAGCYIACSISAHSLAPQD